MCGVKKFLRAIAAVTALAVCGFGVGLGQARAAEQITEDNLVKMLEKVLRDHPELVMDVMRRNSEAVLDIAQQGSNMRRKRNLEAQWRGDIKEPKKVHLEGRPVLGRADAPVRIVAFSDFTCHYCQQASETVSILMREYGKDVSFVFKNYSLEDKSVSAQAAAYFLAIAQQNETSAWSFYKKLFAERDRLMAEGEEYLKKTAQSLDVDMKRLQRDARGKKISDMLAEDQQDAQKLGVEGTPYFLVNDLVIRGALPLDLFRAGVETALRQAR
jgi:protein-disulfide isomerase